MAGQTVWLVGMMGAGKSAVGASLSKQLQVPFLDTDAEVEREAGMRVAEIFAREGEPAFRVRERKVIDAAAGRPSVVALGGGAIAQPGVSEKLRETGTVVYLRATVDSLLARVGAAEDRPLLAGLDASGRRQRLVELLEAREIHYRTAEVSVETDAVDVEEVVARILRELSDRGRRASSHGSH